MKAMLKKLFGSRKSLLLVIPFLILAVCLVGCTTFSGGYAYDVKWQAYEPNANCEADFSKPLSPVHVWTDQGSNLAQIPYVPIVWGNVYIPLIQDYIPVVGINTSILAMGQLKIKFNYIPKDKPNVRCECEFNFFGSDNGSPVDWIVDSIHDEPNKVNRCKIFVDDQCAQVWAIQKHSFFAERVLGASNSAGQNEELSLEEVLQQAEEMGVEFPPEVYQKAQDYLNQSQ